MSRLRQYFANRYGSSEATNAEFENIIRYLNSAELGNLTLGELMQKIFDAEGEVNLGISFRFDAATGIEFKLDESSDDWTLLVPAVELRGAPGINVGTIEAPLLSSRVEIVATASQTAFPYVITADAATVMVWTNGVLEAESNYTYNRVTGVLTFGAGKTAGAVITIASIRTSPSSAYRRADLTAASAQVTFPFPHSATEELIVFRNGVFQRPGGGFDYIASPSAGVITMTSAQTLGAVITIVCITNSLIRDVAGLMLEDRYATGGLIRLDRVAIGDDAIAQAKIAGLVAALAARARVSVGPTPPTGAVLGEFWINTGTSVPSLLFWDGVRWLSASPNGLIPLPTGPDALRYLRLNATATALEYAPLDFSGLVQSSTIGLANGIAPLNPAAKIARTNLPSYAYNCPIIGRIAGAIANATFQVGIIANAKHTFRGLSARVASGSVTLQLQVNGVNVGSTLAVTTTASRLAITEIVEDATATPRTVALVATGGATPVDLTYHIDTLIDE